jgi:hypothetical protein
LGTEAFWIPAALAAVSAGGQYVNQKNAASRQDQGEAQAIRDQSDLQQQAAGKASALTKQIAVNNPNQIAAKATGDYVSQLRKNAAGASQPGTSSALAPAVGANSRYNSDVGKSAQTVGDYGNNMAGQMGQIDAAVRQRQNEGLAQQSLGTDLNTLGAQSYTKNFVDQLRAQAAGVQSPWLSLFSGMAGAGASAMAKNGAFTKGAPDSTGAVLGNGTVSGFSPNAADSGALSGFKTNYWDK